MSLLEEAIVACEEHDREPKLYKGERPRSGRLKGVFNRIVEVGQRERCLVVVLKVRFLREKIFKATRIGRVYRRGKF